MGFFAVVKPLAGDGYNDPTEDDFEVRKLDTNIWLLPLLFGRHAVYCDVGVRLRALAASSRFDVAVPFATADGALSDLNPVMRDREVAALVFGDAEPSDHDLCRSINTSSSRLIEGLSSSNFSLWRIELQRALAPGEEAYFRFRFEAKSLGPTVSWRRASLRRVGVLVDLHYYDPREAVLVPEGDRYPQAMVDAEEVNAFFIVLASLRLRKTSPELRYLRLLEGRKWERYLGRATDLRRRGKFLVHFWRAPGDRVGAGREFRSFLDLGRRTESLGWSTALTLVLATTALVVLTHEADSLWASPIGRGLGLLWDSLKWVLGGGIAATLVGLATRLPRLRRLVAEARRLLRTVEGWLYRKVADL